MLMLNMLLSVPMEARVWSGVGWSEGSPGQKLQDLHQKLVDLKMDMQKLNDEAGGQLLFVSTKCTVNVLKFQTLSSFYFQIKCWLSGLEFTKCLSE